MMQSVLIPEIEVMDYYGDSIDLNKSLYNSKLQDGLMKYSVERDKLKVICSYVYRMPSNIEYNDGKIFMCLGINRDKMFENEIRDKFSTLKSMSFYNKYIFDKFNEVNVSSIFKNIKHLLPVNFDNNIYCINYEKGNNIKQVTLFDFKDCGAVLTELNFRCE